MRIAQRPELTAMPIPPQSLMVDPKTYTVCLHGSKGRWWMGGHPDGRCYPRQS